jgi:hypothetical protein
VAAVAVEVAVAVHHFFCTWWSIMEYIKAGRQPSFEQKIYNACGWIK